MGIRRRRLLHNEQNNCSARASRFRRHRRRCLRSLIAVVHEPHEKNSGAQSEASIRLTEDAGNRAFFARKSLLAVRNGMLSNKATAVELSGHVDITLALSLRPKLF